MNKKRAARNLAKAKTRKKQIQRSTEAIPLSAACTQLAAHPQGSGPPGTNATPEPAGNEQRRRASPGLRLSSTGCSEDREVAGL